VELVPNFVDIWSNLTGLRKNVLKLTYVSRCPMLTIHRYNIFEYNFNLNLMMHDDVC